MDVRETALVAVQRYARAYDNAQRAMRQAQEELVQACVTARFAGARDREISEQASEVMEEGLTRSRIQQLRQKHEGEANGATSNVCGDKEENRPCQPVAVGENP